MPEMKWMMNVLNAQIYKKKQASAWQLTPPVEGPVP
jgi:hypothetical protein